MYVQKLAVIGVLIAAIIAVVLTSLITNYTEINESPLSAAPPVITTAVAETSTNSTNSTSQIIHHPENLTLSPSTHHPSPPLPSPQNKSLSENRLRGPTLPSSSEPIHGPVPGTASP
jgi:hypothetical protein